MVNKKLVDLLSHFGKVEVKNTYTTHNDIVNTYIIFIRNDYHFEMTGIFYFGQTLIWNFDVR